jgi:hypothetical protein
MSALRRFAHFWYDFVVGDDWRVAAAVVAGMGVSAIVAHAGVPGAWIVLPLTVVAVLGFSVVSARRTG